MRLLRMLLTSINENVWKNVETGWKRLKKDMTKEEKVSCNSNNKAFNVIFVVVSPEEFRRIVNVDISYT
jgi:hypothetical protein